MHRGRRGYRGYVSRTYTDNIIYKILNTEFKDQDDTQKRIKLEIIQTNPNAI